jgi:hypothetical protein
MPRAKTTSSCRRPEMTQCLRSSSPPTGLHLLLVQVKGGNLSAWRVQARGNRETDLRVPFAFRAECASSTSNYLACTSWDNSCCVYQYQASVMQEVAASEARKILPCICRCVQKSGHQVNGSQLMKMGQPHTVSVLRQLQTLNATPDAAAKCGNRGS